MVSPGPVSPPAPMEVGSPAGAKTTRILCNYGFHLLAVLLGIALAFM
jgi:hypothetical protein